ncbi:MAG: MMPL family transporter [Gammaproteobacteria bacterium]|nr:MMPL family transporter [Gammaproteobacteria bacterium]
MKKIICFVADHPKRFLLALFLISILALTQVQNLVFNVSAESMMVKNDPAITLYNRAIETYGSDNLIMLYVEDKQLYTPNKLKQLKAFIEQIELIPQVKSTDSLFTLAHVKTVDGEVKSSPYLETVPDTIEAIEEIKKQALHNPFIANNLVSKNNNAMAINVYIKPGINTEEEQKLSEQIEQNLKQLSSFNNAYQIGNPFVLQSITNRLVTDMEEILPLSLAVLMITLGLTLRRAGGLFIPMVTASLSILWTFAMMAAFDIPVNVMTSIVPALLVIIGSTEDIHMMSEYYSGINLGRTRKESIEKMAINMSTAITFTFLTTYIGFLSISLNNIEVLSQFGLVASTGLLFNFLITILFIPAILKLLGSQKSTGNRNNKNSEQSNTLFENIAVSVYVFVQSRKKLLLFSIIVISIICLYGTTLLKVNNSSLDYFDKHSEVRKRINTLQENLSGMETMSIILDSGIDGTFLKLKYLYEIQKIQEFLKDSKIADLSLSFVDYMSLINVAMEEDDSGDLYLPDDDNIVREYMFFVKKEHVKAYASFDYSQTRIFVRHQISSSYELNIALNKIQKFIDENIDPGLKVHITGNAILSTKASDYMARAQAESLILMTITIFIIISVLFFNFKAGLVAIVPNIIPIVVLFGVMGFFGIPLNTGTAMTAAIALGICVDDTMHFMVRYHHEIKKNINDSNILHNTVKNEATAILSTSVALAMGFAVMAVSSFPPIAHFGILSAFVIILALLATFVITPVMLSMTSLVSIWDMISLSINKEVLNNSPLFKNMSELQVRKTIALCQVNDYDKDVVVIHQGDEDNHFYVLLDGEVSVSIVDETGSRNYLNTLQSGEVFGEIAFSSRQTRTADVISDTKVSLLLFNVKSMSRIARLYPRVANTLLINLSFILGSRISSIFQISNMTHDDYSGALKRNFFETFMNKEIANANRYKESLCLLLFRLNPLLDSDDEKTKLVIMERVISKHAAKVILATRTVDTFARWNSNIFAVLMPKTTMAQARVVANRIIEYTFDVDNPKDKASFEEILLTKLYENETHEEFKLRIDNEIKKKFDIPVVKAIQA